MDLLRLRLKELYAEKNTTQKKVAQETGVRETTLSGLSRGKRTSWDLMILERLMIYFEIEDVSEMIEFKPPEDVDKFIEMFEEQKLKYTKESNRRDE